MLVSARVDEMLGKRLEDLSKKTHKTKSFYLKEALENYLLDLEDVRLAENRLKKLKQGKDSILSSKDFWSSLGR